MTNEGVLCGAQWLFTRSCLSSVKEGFFYSEADYEKMKSKGGIIGCQKGFQGDWIQTHESIGCVSLPHTVRYGVEMSKTQFHWQDCHYFTIYVKFIVFGCVFPQRLTHIQTQSASVVVMNWISHVLVFTEIHAKMCRGWRFCAVAGRKWHRHVKAAAHHWLLHFLHWSQWVPPGLLFFSSPSVIRQSHWLN